MWGSEHSCLLEPVRGEVDYAPVLINLYQGGLILEFLLPHHVLLTEGGSEAFILSG